MADKRNCIKQLMSPTTHVANSPCRQQLMVPLLRLLMLFLTGLATDEVPDVNNGIWVSLKTGRGQDYLTGNVF
jgi:hypothetical protein